MRKVQPKIAFCNYSFRFVFWRTLRLAAGALAGALEFAFASAH